MEYISLSKLFALNYENIINILIICLIIIYISHNLIYFSFNILSVSSHKSDANYSLANLGVFNLQSE